MTALEAIDRHRRAHEAARALSEWGRQCVRQGRAQRERRDVAWLLTERTLRQRVIADAEAYLRCAEREAAKNTASDCRGGAA